MSHVIRFSAMKRRRRHGSPQFPKFQTGTAKKYYAPITFFQIAFVIIMIFNWILPKFSSLFFFSCSIYCQVLKRNQRCTFSQSSHYREYVSINCWHYRRHLRPFLRHLFAGAQWWRVRRNSSLFLGYCRPFSLRKFVPLLWSSCFKISTLLRPSL